MMRSYRIELLLIVSIVVLIGQLSWPAALRWWWQPSPGSIGVDQYKSNGSSLGKDFLVYLPQDYGHGLWSLVVYLHGAGERGTDPTALRDWGPFAAATNRFKVPAVVVGPQCLPDSYWSPDAVMQITEYVASRYDVDRQRIYLVGFSMGGYGAWRTAVAHPNRFAAIVPICSSGPHSEAAALGNIPVWAFHGADDDVVPLSECERMVDAIRSVGGQPRLTVIPNAGHGVCNAVCVRPDLWEWLLNQKVVGQ